MLMQLSLEISLNCTFSQVVTTLFYGSHFLGNTDNKIGKRKGGRLIQTCKHSVEPIQRNNFDARAIFFDSRKNVRAILGSNFGEHDEDLWP